LTFCFSKGQTVLTKTTDRQNLLAQLLAPYAFFEVSAGHGRTATIEWALVTGAAAITADALLANPGSDFWRCEFPLEASGDGAALRWLRETLAGDPEADKNFDQYARVPGCEIPRRTAEVVRWLIQQRFTATQAIAALSGDSVDSPISQVEEIPAYVRERLICAFPPDARDALRASFCDYVD
jgi:hypothetical protein